MFSNDLWPSELHSDISHSVIVRRVVCGRVQSAEVFQKYAGAPALILIRLSSGEHLPQKQRGARVETR
jgi:hypothetical protein